MFLVYSGDMRFFAADYDNRSFLESAHWKSVNKDGTSNMFYDPTGMFALATDGIYSLEPQGGRVEEINVF